MLPSSSGQKPSGNDRPPTRLGNMINLMNGSLGDYSQLHSLSLLSTKDENRAQAIMWMKQVASGFKITPEARDSGIMIFDKFHSLTVAEDANTYSDIRFISYSAAASIVLGSKLHDGKRCLTLAGFQDFRLETLKYYECLILTKIGFTVCPQITPLAFAQEFILLWQSKTNKSPHLKIADCLIAKFWEESSSLLFAPSTIAISALILSFSILHMDCSEWLSSLPNFCLHFDEKNTSSNAPDHRFYDIDCCLRSFKNINGILSRSPVGQKPSRTSPTSVAAEPESPPPRTSFQPIPRSSGKRKFNNVAQDGTCPGDDRKILKPSFEAPAPLAPRNLQCMSQFQDPILCNAVIPTAKRGDNYFVENNDITLRAVEPRTEIVILSEPPSQPGK